MSLKLARSLEVVEGADRGRTWPLTRRETILGRGDEAHIKLSDGVCSRRHCKITVNGDSVRLLDLHSTNGTWLNQKRVEQAEVATGDLIRIGQTELRLVTREELEEGQAGEFSQLKAKVAQAGNLGRRMRGMGFNSKVALVIFGLALAAWLLTGWSLISGQGKALDDEAKRRGAVLALALASGNREALRLGEEMLIDVNAVAKEDGVVEALVQDRAGRILAPVSRLHQVPGDERGGRALAAEKLLVQEIADGEYDIAMPIRAFDPAAGAFTKVGTARIVFRLAEARGLMLDAWLTALISLLLLLALAGGALYVVVGLVNRPLLKLKDECEAVLKGDQEQVRPPRGFKGLEELGEEMNRLLAKLSQATPVPAPRPPAPPAREQAPRPAGPDSVDQGLRVLGRLVQDGVLILDGANQVRLANQAFAQAMGLQPAALAGRHLLDVVEDKSLLAGVLALMAQAKTQPGRPLKAPAQLSDGRHIGLALHLEMAPDGEPGRVVVVFQGLSGGAPKEAS